MFKYSVSRVSAYIIFSKISFCSNDSNFPKNIANKVDTLPKKAYFNNIVPNVVRQKGPSTHKKEISYTSEEVSLNNGQNGQKCWVTYKDGIYDITNFIDNHPGGKKFIMMSAGGPVDDFWEYWGAHHTSSEVSKYLQQLRVGKLSDYDYTRDVFENNMYLNEPLRSPNLKPYVKFPFEAETSKEELENNYITETSSFFVRNHAPIPFVDDKENHQITFYDSNGETRTIRTPQQLIDEFGTKNIISVLQCSGNRSSEYIKKKGKSKILGKPSEKVNFGLIGNTVWKGIPLATTLLSIYPELNSLNKEEIKRKHLILYGADDYYTSIPLATIFNDKNRKDQCLLATHMNGQELKLDHGYPIRALFPGIVGARSVKWLSKIEISDTTSDSCWNQYFYRNGTKECFEIPLNSMITNSKIENDIIYISGVAYGDGEIIQDVQLSFDEGNNWVSTQIVKGQNNLYGWVKWEYQEYKQKLIKDQDNHIKVCCKALSDKRTQQLRLGDNYQQDKDGGYLYNGWHEIKIIK